MSTNPPLKAPTKPPTDMPNARGMLQGEKPASQAVFRLARRPEPSPSSIARGQASALTEVGGRKRIGDADDGARRIFWRSNGPGLSG